MSSYTHSLQVFLFLPLHLTQAATYISTGQHPIVHLFTLLRSRCLNHHNLPYLTTSAILYTQKKDYKFTLRFLSFSDTRHIHLTIIRSVLFRISFFIAQVSVPYVNTLWTQTLYIFPFMRYDAPRAVRIGDNSLNLALAHLARCLRHTSCTKCVAQIANLGTHSNFTVGSITTFQLN